MINLGCEADLGRLEGVICREANGEEKDTARVWRVTLTQHETDLCDTTDICTYGAHDRCLPLEHVITRWTSAA